MSATRPNLVVDGKLDHPATTAELRRCLDTLLRTGRFELSYDIRATAAATRTSCWNATPNCSRRSNTSRYAGFGSIPNFMAASASMPAAIARFASRS